ncbi:uncharacterized protein F4812DRAFT_462952 [Daldinia caldariorum]|uniref:uncharacterized protein n=1 Tax=Daldinia caldariorum TaxID=326644 RepID=UPI002008712A|nr:uncharacterized protein F4812DRAFT_462952 [Daldinia caldariorum]KAI1464202.1 hypothetical protein F4812DRAFT_462952 [Daldinia caldariorum]
MDSSTRHTVILDLSNELLGMIFEELKASLRGSNDEKTHIERTRAIGNVRLTCQRFCSTSSHILLDTVTVEMNLLSVRRFLDMSQQPLIAHGVRTIRVLLHYYDRALAESLQIYGFHNALKIHDVQIVYPSRARDEIEREIRIQERYETDRRLVNIQIGQLNYGSFERMLRSAHDIYRSFYEEQEYLQKQKLFSYCITRGIARMSGVRELEFCDGKIHMPSIRNMRRPDKMLQMMIAPHTWFESVYHGLKSPPSEVIVDLPLILGEIGVQLPSLRIEVLLNKSNLGELNQKFLTNLAATMTNLKNFACIQKPEHRYDRRAPTPLSIPGYVRAMLDGSNIEEIHLYNYPKGGGCTFDSIPQIYWPNLKRVRLGRAHFHSTCLCRFLHGCNPVVFKHLHIREMILLDGTWAETLDILRRSNLVHVTIYRPLGGESSALSIKKRKEFNELFRTDTSGLSKATKYIQGLATDNPVMEVV